MILSGAAVVWHFNLEKYHSHFASTILTIVDLFYCLFWGFYMLNTYTVASVFVKELQNANSYLPVSTLTFKKINGTFFVDCLSLNIYIYISFHASNLRIRQPILSCCILRSSTPYFFLYKREKRNIYLSWWPPLIFKISMLPFFLLHL